MIENKIIMIDSLGVWPKHSFKDITNAREELFQAGVYGDSTTHLREITLKSLDYRFFKTDTTYRRFMENNEITKFIIDNSLENCVLVTLDDTTIQINGIKIDVIEKCGFCPNTFRLHSEPVELRDGRYVCHECYAKVFDAVLQSSKGSGNYA